MPGAAVGGDVAARGGALAALLAHRRSSFAGTQVDPAARRLDLVDADGDRIAEPDPRAAAASRPAWSRCGRARSAHGRRSAGPAGSPRRRRRAAPRKRTKAPAPITPETSPSKRVPGPALEQLALEQEGGADVSRRRAPGGSRRARARSPCAPVSATNVGARARPRRRRSAESSAAVGDQVRVAADRRGEVDIGGAAEPGVAEVAIRVVGLLERAKHKRCIRLAPVPPPLRLAGRPAGSPRRASSAAWRGASRPGSGRRDVERGELLDQHLDRAPDRAARGPGRGSGRGVARAARRPARW